MKIEVAKEDLQAIREILWEGRKYYARARLVRLVNPSLVIDGNVTVGTKMIKRINAALKKTHGHDCCGEHYL